jgi:MerR family transcriptional regulator, aldehyde-responsive regulator
LAWVKIIKCLRHVGTENKQIKHYVDLCLQGDNTMQERYQIILDTKNKALASLEELKKQIEILNYKESFYGNLIASKATFDPWNPNNAKKLREA